MNPSLAKKSRYARPPLVSMGASSYLLACFGGVLCNCLESVHFVRIQFFWRKMSNCASPVYRKGVACCTFTCFFILNEHYIAQLTCFLVGNMIITLNNDFCNEAVKPRRNQLQLITDVPHSCIQRGTHTASHLECITCSGITSILNKLAHRHTSVAYKIQIDWQTMTSVNNDYVNTVEQI